MIRAWRKGPRRSAVLVELAFAADGTPVIFYGHDGITHKQGQLLKRWLDAVEGRPSREQLLLDTGPTEPEAPPS